MHILENYYDLITTVVIRFSAKLSGTGTADGLRDG